MIGAQRLRYKLLAGLALTVSLGFVATALFYMRQAENAILAEQDRALHKVTEAVGSSLETIMLGGHAEVAAEYTRRLATVGAGRRFTVLRRDGSPAFSDNATIERVNAVLGEQAFATRAESTGPAQPIIDVRSAAFREALAGQEARSQTRLEPNGEKVLEFFDPIFGQEGCRRCHAEREKVLGVVVIETSFVPVERDMNAARGQALIGLAIALAVTMALTGYLLGRMLFNPIEAVTRAMRRVSKGDWEHGVPVQSADEIGQMASNFNSMREQLRDTYVGMVAEQDKLTTILLAAREAVVVTDPSGQIVLVNPAAEEVLGKSMDQIQADGFDRIVDDPALIHSILAGEQEEAAITIAHRGRMLELSASSISDAAGAIIGSAALIRDVDEEYRMREQLVRMARTDELTGLYNRRHLDERFGEEFARACDTGRPLSVMIFDIDHFKRFNDTYGHEAGDRVLRAVGMTTRETLRRYDVLGRYGGEEFVAVLPGLHAPDAGRVAERLRADISALDIEGLKVTISVGVACTQEVAAANAEALLVRADEALYRAKRNGRNRVELAAPDQDRQKAAALT